MADIDDLSLEAALNPNDQEQDSGDQSAIANSEPETEPGQQEAEDSGTPPEAEDKKSDDEPWHVKAVMTEREKRQAAERERDELRKKLEAQAEEQPRTSVFEDEAKWQKEFDQSVEQRVQNIRYDMSQRLAEKEYGADKVGQAMEAFKSIAEQDKALAAEVFEDPLPYFKMIEIVERQEKAKRLEELDSDAYREKLKAEMREELMKELEAQKAEKASKREGLTPSLASARSSGVGTETDAEPKIERAEEVFPV